MPTELLDNLLKNLGNYIIELTNRKLLLVGESVISKQTVPYCMVEDNVSSPPIWYSNEVYDPATGKMSLSYNGTVSIIITTAKDDPVGTPNRRTASGDAVKIINAFQLPFINYKYFSGGNVAYSSSTNPIKQRVPLDSQTYENRARFVVTFNVCWLDTDYGSFEKLEKVRITSNVEDVNSITTVISETQI